MSLGKRTRNDTVSDTITQPLKKKQNPSQKPPQLSYTKKRKEREGFIEPEIKKQKTSNTIVRNTNPFSDIVIEKQKQPDYEPAIEVTGKNILEELEFYEDSNIMVPSLENAIVLYPLLKEKLDEVFSLDEKSDIGDIIKYYKPLRPISRSDVHIDFISNDYFVKDNNYLNIKTVSGVLRYVYLKDFPLLQRLSDINRVLIKTEDSHKQYMKQWYDIFAKALFEHEADHVFKKVLYCSNGINGNFLYQTSKRMSYTKLINETMKDNNEEIRLTNRTNHYLITLNTNKKPIDVSDYFRRLRDKRFTNFLFTNDDRSLEPAFNNRFKGILDDLFSVLPSDDNDPDGIIGFGSRKKEYNDLMALNNINYYYIKHSRVEVEGTENGGLHYHGILEINTMVLTDQYIYLYYRKLAAFIKSKLGGLSFYLNIKDIRNYSGSIEDYIKKEDHFIQKDYQQNMI